MSQLCGGFNAAQAPTEEELAIFKKFEAQVKSQAGAEENAAVEIVSVSTQVVAGCNFKYVVKVGDKTFKVTIFRGLKSPDDLSLSEVVAQ